MSTDGRIDSHDERPEFMAILGLGPPYAIEDVKQAYLEKAKRAHPDRGGTTAEFNKIHQAFEQAQVFLEFRGDRRGWIASHMERYVAQERAIERLHVFGAVANTRTHEWLQNSFGDFAQLTETIAIIRAVDVPNGDALVGTMVEEYKNLRELRELELPGARLSDEAVLSLGVFSMLKRLDLSRTPITSGALAVVDQLEALEEFNIEGTSIGWWPRTRLQAKLRRRAAE